MAAGRNGHRRAQPKCIRARGDEWEEAQRRRDLAEPGEVVLDEERAAEAERLRLDVVVDELPEPHAAIHVGAASLRLRAAEESESHLVAPCPAPGSRAAGITLHGKRRTFRNFPGGRGNSRLCYPPPEAHPEGDSPGCKEIGMDEHRTDRRDFLKQVTAVGAARVIPGARPALGPAGAGPEQPPSTTPHLPPPHFN